LVGVAGRAVAGSDVTHVAVGAAGQTVASGVGVLSDPVVAGVSAGVGIVAVVQVGGSVGTVEGLDGEARKAHSEVVLVVAGEREAYRDC